MATFKLKTLPEQGTLIPENGIRRIVKAHPEVTSAWLLGILLPGKKAKQEFAPFYIKLNF